MLPVPITVARPVSVDDAVRDESSRVEDGGTGIGVIRAATGKLAVAGGDAAVAERAGRVHAECLADGVAAGERGVLKCGVGVGDPGDAPLVLRVDDDVLPVARFAGEPDNVREHQHLGGRVGAGGDVDPCRVRGDAEGVLDGRRSRLPRRVGRGGVFVALRDIHVAPGRDGEGARAGRLATGAVDDLEGHDVVAGRREDHALARPLGLEDVVAVEVPEVAEAEGVAGHLAGLERGGDGAVAVVFRRLPGAGEGRDELRRADVDVRAADARVAAEVGRGGHPGRVGADVEDVRAGQGRGDAVLVLVGRGHKRDGGGHARDVGGGAVREGRGVARPVDGLRAAVVAVAPHERVRHDARDARDAADVLLFGAGRDVVRDRAVLDDAPVQ